MSLLLAALFALPLTTYAALAPDSPTVLITGANRGIGLELAKQYAEQGWNVIATTRRVGDDPGAADLRKLAAKHPKLVIERIDVADTAMIRGVAVKHKDQSIDVLINNAANVEDTLAADIAIVSMTYDKINFDKSLRDFDVNTVGPMRMAQAFMPHVEKSAQKKIVNITSSQGALSVPRAGMAGMNYGASKAALNKYSVVLANQVKDKGVIVALVQPIFVASKKDMKDNPRASPLDQEITKLIKLIDKMTLAHSGVITNFTTGKTDPF
jgi:NAD(P)-dependent dehydrogenase (short-subunit alcohol dehydrogenase family)